ncbi:MAG: OmpA family protein [Phycisphaerales bacterium]|nr:OmpA family protein [Phycisphaerales bacterium]
MARIFPTTCAAAAVTLPLLASGCVQQDKYDNLLQVKRSLQEQLLTVTDERDAMQSQLSNRTQQLTAARGDISLLQERYEILGGELDQISLSNQDLAMQVSAMEIGPLPADVQAALARLASQYPDQVTFDPETGMLRFNSDLTFNSGKDQVKDAGATSLTALATILDSPSAENFELVILGHTDDVPVKYSRNQHPTNMHLSVHRAIAVRDVLVNSGINADRVQVAGWGEYKPLVPNESGGTAVNRRVEIYLTSQTETSMADTTTPTTTTTTTAVVETDEPMK